MRFMKGLDAPTMIAIIIAVIAGLIILYLLWTKGMIPWLFGANEAECRTALIKACAFSGTDREAQLEKINSGCPNNYKDRPTLQAAMKSCISAPEDNTDCDTVCAEFG